MERPAFWTLQVIPVHDRSLLASKALDGMASWKAGIVAALVLGGATYGLLVYAFALRPATPSLLKGVRDVGGWNSGGCPPPPGVTAMGREALSPELMSRLAAAFPPESDPEVLRSTLLAAGFRLIEPCKEDPAIRRAWFRQAGGGPFGPFPMSAVVAWRVGPEGRIGWTKGLVAFTGL